MPEKVFRQEMLWGRAIGIRDRERLRDWNFLRCRSTIKTIHKNHKLAFGSDSVIFMNNIVVQHQRKSTVPAEVPGPVFPSSVPHFSGSDSHLFQIFHSTFPIYSTILFLQGGAQRSSPVCGFPAARSGSWQAPTTAPRDKQRETGETISVLKAQKPRQLSHSASLCRYL